jgi:hypothetical protein
MVREDAHSDGGPPSLKIRIFFWTLMGIISVFFAELVSGSTPFPYFSPAGWLIVFPVYALHIVVLGTVILRYGKPSLYVMFPAGMIFGMYETYITKVIWGSADWANNTPSVGGIYIIPFLLIVLFWHPFFSFIIPLQTSEVLLTSSRETLSYLPRSVSEVLQNGKNSEIPLFSSPFSWDCSGPPAHLRVSPFSLEFRGLCFSSSVSTYGGMS